MPFQQIETWHCERTKSYSCVSLVADYKKSDGGKLECPTSCHRKREFEGVCQQGVGNIRQSIGRQISSIFIQGKQYASKMSKRVHLVLMGPRPLLKSLQ